MKIEHQYLHFPVRNGAEKHWIFLKMGDKVLREFEIELGKLQAGENPHPTANTTGQGADWWAFLDASAWIGQEISLSADPPAPSFNFANLAQSDEILDLDGCYQEKYRPQFHFSPRRGWINDPNGLVYYLGQYHLFFQHNPYGTAWGNMHWGHAVSLDLLHWRELPEALYPDNLGVVFSGSAVVDWHNSAGLQIGGQPALVCLYTAAGGLNPSSEAGQFKQCLACSTDGGSTLHNYTQNPVLDHIIKENRDPKVTWHAPSHRWIMALFKDGNEYGLFSSPDLKNWRHLYDLTLPGCSECPDFFELPIENEHFDDGKATPSRWVFTAANGHYVIGRFDGARFTPETDVLQVDYGGNYYAVQTYSDTPDGRRIQLAWMAGGAFPGMKFNQQMSFPCELKLHRSPAGLRLYRTPIQEIDRLHQSQQNWQNLVVADSDFLLDGVHRDLLDIRAEIDPGNAATCGLKVWGEQITYSAIDRTIACLGHSAPLEIDDAPLRLQILVDRTSIEVFANDGAISLTSCVLHSKESSAVSVYSTGGAATIKLLQVFELHSTW